MIMPINRESLEQENEGKILVVEDDPLLRGLLLAQIEQLGYMVITASDGVEALQRIEAEIPDLIISDISMPNMNGLELLSRLRENPETMNLPIILLSAHTDSEDMIDDRLLNIGNQSARNCCFSI